MANIFRTSRGTAVAVTRPYDETAGLGLTSVSGVEYFSILFTHHTNRIRMPGTVTGAKVELGASVESLASIVFRVWRTTGSGENYTLIGTSENVIAQASNDTFTTFTFATPITSVLRGDVYSIDLGTASGIDAADCVRVRTNVSDADDVQAYGFRGAAPVTASPNDWSSSPDYNNKAGLTGYLTMDSPTCICFGDSFMSSTDHTLSFLFDIGAGTNWLTGNTIGRSIIERLYLLDPVLFNGMTHGQGSTSTHTTHAMGWLSTRTDSPSDYTQAESTTWLQKEVIDYSPRFAIMSFGANDASTSAAQKVLPEAFRKNIMTICHKLLAADIMPVCLGVFNTNDADTNRENRYRTYNDIIKTYCIDRGLPFIDVQRALDGYTDTGAGGNWGQDGRNVVEFGTGTHGNTAIPIAAAQLIHAKLLEWNW